MNFTYPYFRVPVDEQERKKKDRFTSIHSPSYFFPQDCVEDIVCWTPNISGHEKGHGKKEEVKRIRYLFVDLDDKNKTRRLTLQKVLDATKELPPTAIVETSRGSFHVYWDVRKARLSVEHAERLNKLLCHKLGGDRQCTNPNRLMRVPGSINAKYGKPFTARVVHDSGYAYGTEVAELANKVRMWVQRLEPTVKPSRQGTPAAFPDAIQPILDTLAGAKTNDDYNRLVHELYPRRESFRHHLCLFIARDLYCQGYSLDEAKTYIESLCLYAGDDEVKDRLTCVETTYRRAEQGEVTTGTGGGEVVCTAFPVDKENYLGDGRYLPKEGRGKLIITRCALAYKKHQKHTRHAPSQRTLAELVGLTQKTIWKYWRAIHLLVARYTKQDNPPSINVIVPDVVSDLPSSTSLRAPTPFRAFGNRNEPARWRKMRYRHSRFRGGFHLFRATFACN